MEDLPEHLIMEEIFPRVPLTTLFDFRSVCRRFRHQLANNTHCVLVHSIPPSKQVLQSPTTGFITHPKTSHVYIVPDMDTRPLVNKLNSFCKRFEICFIKCELSVSCNGLVCFVNTSCNTIIVGNPVTRDYIETQHPYDVGDDEECWGFGFGFDSKNKEFKLIWLCLPIDPRRKRRCSARYSEVKDPFCVLAQTLGGSFTWRRVGNLRKQIQCIQSRRLGVFFNGSLHWLSFENEGVQYVINVIAVSVADDEEQVLYFPIPFIKCGWIDLLLERVHLGVLGGCLIFVNDCKPEYVEVWVMKEYGIEESWSKDFVIPRPIKRKHEQIEQKHQRFHPLVMQEDGQISVESDDQLLLYDPESRTFKDNNILPLVLLNRNALREQNTP